eukprot:982462-Pleurochrysis_carterae.AAC.2
MDPTPRSDMTAMACAIGSSGRRVATGLVAVRSAGRRSAAAPSARSIAQGARRGRSAARCCAGTGAGVYRRCESCWPQHHRSASRLRYLQQ